MVDLMVQLLWSNFFFKSIYESFGSLTRCKLNVDQEEWKWPKNECVGFFNMPKKAVLEEDKKFTFNQYIIFSCLDLFFPLKNITWKIIITTFLCHGPLPFFYQSTSIFTTPWDDFIVHVVKSLVDLFGGHESTFGYGLLRPFYAPCMPTRGLLLFGQEFIVGSLCKVDNPYSITFLHQSPTSSGMWFGVAPRIDNIKTGV